MQKKMNCIIVDDEPLARKGIEMFVSNISFLELAASCSNPLEALRELKEQPIDLMFLDIQMPEMSGIEMLRSIHGLPITIITTAFPDYALMSYELDVIDYLVKPISNERFCKAVNKAKDYYNLQHPPVGGEQPDFIFIKCDNSFVKVDFEEILFITAQGNYASIQLTDRKLLAYLTVKNLEESLPAGKFIRINKSHLVALSKIESISGNEIKMGKHSFIISRLYKEQVLEQILNDRLVKRK